MRVKGILLALEACSFLYLTQTAFAAEACPEGKTVTGECVNAGLAATMRLNALVYSQSQLSHTAQPIMPQQDYTYRYPHALTTTPPQGQGDVTPVPSPPTSFPPPLPAP